MFHSINILNAMNPTCRNGSLSSTRRLFEDFPLLTCFFVYDKWLPTAHLNFMLFPPFTRMTNPRRHPIYRQLFLHIFRYSQICFNIARADCPPRHFRYLFPMVAEKNPQIWDDDGKFRCLNAIHNGEHFFFACHDNS